VRLKAALDASNILAAAFFKVALNEDKKQGMNLF